MILPLGKGKCCPLLLHDKYYGVNQMAAPVAYQSGLPAEDSRSLPRAVAGKLPSWHGSILKAEYRPIRWAAADRDTALASLAELKSRRRTGLTCVNWLELCQREGSICQRTSGYVQSLKV